MVFNLLRMTSDEWDASAAGFDDAPDHGLRDPAVRAAWRDLLGGVLPVAPVRVADLGCGTGTLAELLVDSGHVVDGVDSSPAMLKIARAKVPTDGSSWVMLLTLHWARRPTTSSCAGTCYGPCPTQREASQAGWDCCDPAG